MDVLYDYEGYVDIESPIFMNEKQVEKFVQGLKNIFKDIKVKKIKEKIRESHSFDRKHKKWLVDELYFLISENSSTEEVARKLGRNPFSIVMKRGSWLLPLYSWAKKKKLTEITKKDIEEYIDSH